MPTSSRMSAVGPLAKQLIAVWVAGMVAVIYGVIIAVGFAFGGPDSRQMIGFHVLAAVVVMCVACWLIVRSTRAVTVLGGSEPLRLTWALLVTVVGASLSALLLFAESRTDVLSIAPGPMLLPGQALPFVLVSGALVRSPRVRIVAVVGLAAVLIATVLLLQFG
jgi:hypothetical protein